MLALNFFFLPPIGTFTIADPQNWIALVVFLDILDMARIAFAKREGITHVIFGQTARSRWEILLKGSTLNRFLEEVRDAAIQVVPLGETA